MKKTKEFLSVKSIRNEFKKQKFTPKTFPKSFPILGKIQPFTAFAKHAVKSKKSQVKPEILVAGVERFELPNDGVRVRSLTAWRHPNISCQNDDRLLCRARQTHFTTIFYTFFRRLASVFISIFIFFFFNSIITLPEKKFCN